ncbi:MAG: DNA (cytosine-5-)-methyltransferase [bacterium]
MNNNRVLPITAISLFSGCGGSDLGLIGGFSFLKREYSSTGVSVVHASDINAKAVATYNLNFEHKAVVEDVNNLRFNKNEADMIMGGFPCQPFSTVNPTKNPAAKRNQLFWQMADIIEQVQPRVFIAENVKGFYRLSSGKYFDMAKNEFSRLGYKICYKIVDASDYGVPQKRERLFIVGIRSDIDKIFSFPEATHGEFSRLKKAKVPLKSVVDSLIPEDPKYYFSKRAVEGVKRAKPNMKRALAQNLEGQCLTVTSHLAKVSLNSRDPVLLVNKKKELYRRFTPREAARIQSFPDSFQFAGSEGDAYRQIGNAVPPVIMWHLTTVIVKQIFSGKSSKAKDIRPELVTA